MFQGERAVAAHNKFIGKFMLDGLPPAPAGLKVVCALSIDEDGILSVQAKLQYSSEWQGCTLQLDDRATSDIQANLEDAERCKEEDQREAARLQKKHDLKKHLHNKKEKVLGISGGLFIH